VACRQCGNVWTSYEEKETDVNIAVSLVADAAAAASDIALIISADSDLCPAIRTARSLNPGRGISAAFPPRRSSFEIRSLIRGAFTIAAVDLRNSILPDTVNDPATGRLHSGQASGADARPPAAVQESRPDVPGDGSDRYRLHQQYFSSNKNPNGYCGLGGTGVSCPVGVARADG
jgi:hypothetical protein